MPIRRTRTVDQLDKEFTAKDEMAYFDDDKAMLEMRVRKLDTGYSWSEDPPSRTRHVISNVRIIENNAEDLVVETNFILYRTRLNSEEDMWVGMRRDRIRKDGAAATRSPSATSSWTRPFCCPRTSATSSKR